MKIATILVLLIALHFQAVNTQKQPLDYSLGKAVLDRNKIPTSIAKKIPVRIAAVTPLKSKSSIEKARKNSNSIAKKASGGYPKMKALNNKIKVDQKNGVLKNTLTKPLANKPSAMVSNSLRLGYHKPPRSSNTCSAGRPLGNLFGYSSSRKPSSGCRPGYNSGHQRYGYQPQIAFGPRNNRYEGFS